MGEIIKGKISPTIQGVESLNLRLNERLQIKVMVTRVGKGRPRYVLLALPSGSAPDSP